MNVSVVIPAYNEESYLKICLSALHNQTTPPDEIIVVDNNSTDKTSTISRSLGAKVVNERKQGMIFARNKGFDSARNDLLARIDADVIVPGDWVKRILQNFEAKNIDALTGPISYYDSRLIPKSPLITKFYLGTTRVLTRGNRFLVGPNMVVKKNMWLKIKSKINLDDSKVHEDIDLSLKIIKVGGKIGYDPEMVVKSSARRIVKKPSSFFIEYPRRFVRTLIEDEPRLKKMASKKLF